MQTIIHSTTIVTANDACAVHYDAAIAIDGARIAAIGPNAALLARYPAAERIDGRGKAVMPGFANMHTHLAMTLARGIYEDLSPAHKPPFEGGLAPLPLPLLSASASWLRFISISSGAKWPRCRSTAVFCPRHTWRSATFSRRAWWQPTAGV